MFDFTEIIYTSRSSNKHCRGVWGYTLHTYEDKKRRYTTPELKGRHIFSVSSYGMQRDSAWVFFMKQQQCGAF